MIRNRFGDVSKMSIDSRPRTFVVKRSGSGADVQDVGEDYLGLSKRYWHYDVQENQALNQALRRAKEELQAAKKRAELQTRPAAQFPSLSLSLRPERRTIAPSAAPQRNTSSTVPQRRRSWANIAAVAA